MHNFVVVIFRDESEANEGARVLQALHRDGTVTVYATALLQREPNGELTIKRHSDPGPRGFGVGALAGGLLGLAGGPAASVAGVAVGGMAGTYGDLLHYGVADEVIDAVQRDLLPGTYALVGEVSEDSVEPIDRWMAALGGKVTRQARKDLVAGKVDEDTAAIRSELREVAAEHAGVKAEALQSKIELDMDSARDKLQRTAAKLHTQIDHVRQEIDAKLAVLGDQAARANPEVRDQIQRRIIELRRDLEQREETLKRAYELTEAALH